MKIDLTLPQAITLCYTLKQTFSCTLGGERQLSLPEIGSEAEEVLPKALSSPADYYKYQQILADDAEPNIEQHLLKHFAPNSAESHSSAFTETLAAFDGASDELLWQLLTEIYFGFGDHNFLDDLLSLTLSITDYSGGDRFCLDGNSALLLIFHLIKHNRTQADFANLANLFVRDNDPELTGLSQMLLDVLGESSRLTVSEHLRGTNKKFKLLICFESIIGALIPRFSGRSNFERSCPYRQMCPDTLLTRAIDDLEPTGVAVVILPKTSLEKRHIGRIKEQPTLLYSLNSQLNYIDSIIQLPSRFFRNYSPHYLFVLNSSKTDKNIFFVDASMLVSSEERLEVTILSEIVKSKIIIQGASKLVSYQLLINKDFSPFPRDYLNEGYFGFLPEEEETKVISEAELRKNSASIDSRIAKIKGKI